MQNAFWIRRAARTWVAAKTPRLLATTAVALIGLLGTGVHAQDANNGKALYNTPLVAGERSCSNGACHGPDPLDRQNKIYLGEDAGNIYNAINNLVVQMAFLRGHVSTQQLIDLAAYIADPASATGLPVAQVSPSTLSFGAVAPGSSAPAQQITIANTGTAPLAISGIASSDAAFAVSSGCGVVAVAGNCSVSVTFTPPAVGLRNASITVLHNANGGSSTVPVSGTGAVAAIRVQPAQLVFAPGIVGTATDVQSVAVANDGGAPLTIGSIDIAPAASAFLLAGGSCRNGVVVAAGGSCNILVQALPTSIGPFDGQLVIAHSAGSNVSVALSGEALSEPQQTRLMVEYRYSPLDYYFVTSRSSDMTLLDAISGWGRTGQSFNVLVTDAPELRGISRYYFDQVARGGQRGSHFYTLVDSEKTLLAGLNPNNLQAPRLPYNEGVDSYAFAPLVEGVGGSCTAGQTPVYRLFRGNVKFPDDPNHRFTTSLAIYNQFVGLGWDGEGVKFCVPAQ